MIVWRGPLLVLFRSTDFYTIHALHGPWVLCTIAHVLESLVWVPAVALYDRGFLSLAKGSELFQAMPERMLHDLWSGSLKGSLPQTT